jgi:hypothetical protein
MTPKVSTFSLRLSDSLKAAAGKLSAITAVEAFFAERKGRADRDAAIRFLSRAGGERPRKDDEMPN